MFQGKRTQLLALFSNPKVRGRPSRARRARVGCVFTLLGPWLTPASVGLRELVANVRMPAWQET
eukprot:6180634-Pleurochrysis_carterae.AAC.1